MRAVVQLPSFAALAHKGAGGRIGVIGGCFEYTGAPYYAAMSALRTGADLAYVFCTKEAAVPIKCYSPELIVLPLLDSKIQFGNALKSMFERKRLDTLIVGPGLGRNEETHSIVMEALLKVRDMLGVVIYDADGLFTNFHGELISKGVGDNYLGIATPNHREASSPVCAKWDSLTVLKGKVDVVGRLNEPKAALNEIFASRKRCGGLGDLLSGTIATLMSQRSRGLITHEDVRMVLLAACFVVRKASSKAFEKTGRGMTAPDVLSELPAALSDRLEFNYTEEVEVKRRKTTKL